MMCKPRSYYDEVNKVAIGYKNPLCQLVLYSGHVIVTPNHAPAVVRDCEETLEQSEISRKKMHDKMKTHFSSGPAPNLLTPGPISSGLVPNPAPAIPYVRPTNKELEMLFQPMFDEYFNPPGIYQDPIPNVAQDPVIPSGPSMSIAIDWTKMIREQTVEFIESQEIDRKIEESVKEVVISSVKHAMRAPLRARFKDLPKSDMKEILLE
ncbi:hypothetical protein Tco_0740499, partial [Tanacetum coccineum]